MKRTDQKGIELIFKDHYREFCLLSYSYVGCMDQAQDIVQDVFVKILTKGNISEILTIKAYIWKAVKNTSLNHLERSKKLEPIRQSTLMLSTEDDALDDQLSIKLQKAMNNLPPACKNVFEHCAVEGQKYDSAADSLGISVNTVKTQMKKAYKILRNDLKNLYLILFFFGLNL